MPIKGSGLNWPSLSRQPQLTHICMANFLPQGWEGKLLTSKAKLAPAHSYKVWTLLALPTSYHL